MLFKEKFDSIMVYTAINILNIKDPILLGGFTELDLSASLSFAEHTWQLNLVFNVTSLSYTFEWYKHILQKVKKVILSNNCFDK